VSGLVPQSVWTTVFEKYGVQKTLQGQLEGDPFAQLASQAGAWENQGMPHSRVSLSLTNGEDYGQVKVHVNLSIACPPTEQHISMATEAAFVKGLDLVNDASETLGIGPLASEHH